MSAPGLYLLSPLERIRTLMTVDFLRGLSPEEVSLLAQNVEERAFGKGETILAAGSIPELFHTIVNGEVAASGIEHGETVLGPGRVLGLLTTLARLEEGLQATARTEVRTLSMRSDVLAEVMEDRMSILLHLIRHIAKGTLALRRHIPDGTVLGRGATFEVGSSGRIDLVTRLGLLRRSAIFRRAGVGTLVQLASTIEDRRIPGGQRLWSAGDPSGYFYLVVEGTVRCELPGGTRFYATAGYPLGNLESQAVEPRWYDAVTESPVVALRSEIERFRDVLEDNVDVAMDFLGQVALSRISVGRERRDGLPPGLSAGASDRSGKPERTGGA
jgi:CRP-like cAMP-binding protein